MKENEVTMTMPTFGAGATGRNAGNMMTGNKVAGSPPSIKWGKSSGGYKSGQMQQFTPEQMQLFQQMFGHVGPGSFLSKLAGGDESMFKELEAPAFRQFQGLQGDLASRFSGMGMGARRGSGFANTMNQATSDFAQDLQAQRLGIRNQAIQDLMNMSNQLLGQRPYEQFVMKKDPSFLRQLAMGGMGILGDVAGGWATGSALGAGAKRTMGTSGY